MKYNLCNKSTNEKKVFFPFFIQYLIFLFVFCFWHKIFSKHYHFQDNKDGIVSSQKFKEFIGNTKAVFKTQGAIFYVLKIIDRQKNKNCT